MRPIALSRIVELTGGSLHRGGSADVLVESVVTDTRVLDAQGAEAGRGALFIALRGERFDGNAHVADAAELGACAAIVSAPLDIDLPQVVVADTERALGALAAALQRGRAARVIGITGSNGKTSVKTLLLSILQHAAHAHGRVAYANPGNLNNEIGLPLSVINAPEDAAFAIYEMGAGKPGDIAYLTSVVHPHVAIVNNISAAHLERLGSLDGVADTKAAIYDALGDHGVAVINTDDAFALLFIARARNRRVIRYGFGDGNDVQARNLRLADDRTFFSLVTASGAIDAAIPMAGRHNVANAMAAAALALACDVSIDSIVAGLSDVKHVAGRLVRHRLDNGAVLIDDSYNANPGSLNAAIDTLAAAGGENWLVLGDMRELGVDASALHEAAGTRAREAGIARLYAIGCLSAVAAQAFDNGARVFDTHEALAEALRADLHGTARVLVKGSRGSAMERVVRALLDNDARDAQASNSGTLEVGAHAA